MGRTATVVPAAFAEQKPKEEVRHPTLSDALTDATLPPVSVIPSDTPVGIMGFGVEYPPTVVFPEELEQFVARHYEITPAMQKTLGINMKTGIKSRSLFHASDSPLLGSEKAANIAQIAAEYKKCVVPLAASAARTAIAEWGGSITSITHMVSVTTSDTRNPGFDYFVARELGLSPHVQRTLLHGVGCTGGLAALRTATNMALAAKALGRPASVLCVAAEGISMYARAGMDHIIEHGVVNPSITLFSDCCSSFVVSTEFSALPLPLPTTNGVNGVDHGDAPNGVDEVSKPALEEESDSEDARIHSEPPEELISVDANGHSEGPQAPLPMNGESKTGAPEASASTNGEIPDGTLESLSPARSDSHDSESEEPPFANGDSHDGAAAVVAIPSTASRRPIYTVTAFTVSTIPSTEEDLEIPVGPNGYQAFMSKRVPLLTAAATPIGLAAILAELKLEHLEPSELDWAIHPGGAAVLRAVEMGLGLSEDDHTRASWKVYSEHGNSSAATIVSVLNTARKPGYGKRENLVTVAFGPGVNVEMLLLKRH